MASSPRVEKLQFDSAWVEHVPPERIPHILSELANVQAALAARLAMAPPAAPAPADLVDAPALAKRLGVPESHVRTLQRAGAIPSRRIGKYVRFNVVDVEAALTARPQRDRRS